MAVSDVKNALVAVVTNTAPRPQFMLSFFGAQVLQDTKYVELQGMFSKARVAQFVNPDAVADGTESLSFSRTPFVLPTIQDIQTITAKDLETIRLGENEYTPSTTTEKFWYAVSQKVQDQRNMISHRNEKSAIEAMFDGQITVLGKGENRVIDFGRPAELTVDIGASDAQVYFDGTSADVDKVIDDAIELLGSYGKVSDTIIGRPDVIRYIVRDERVKANLDNRRAELGGEAYVNMLTSNGVIYHGTYKNQAIFSYTGVDSAVPANKIVFVASNNGNVTVNGYSPDMTSELGDMGIAATSVKDARNFISNLIPGRKSAEVEAIQTVAPMLADVYSAASFQVLA